MVGKPPLGESRQVNGARTSTARSTVRVYSCPPITTVIDGEEYTRTVDRAIEVRAPLTWRLSPNGGFPTIAVPAGFTKEVYDRAVVRGPDGGKQAGELVGPKAVELPVSIDFLGRPFSEPVLIRIAAAYERATHHRRPPQDFVGMPVAFTPGPPRPALLRNSR